MAVRAALGAGRARLLRQLLTEVLALFLLGAFGGFLVALFATAALERLPLPGTVPISLELSPDLRVFAFTLAISLARGPRLRPRPGAGARRATDITSRLRDDSPGSGSSRGLLMRGADHRPAGAVARAARGRRAVHAGAGQRAADRSGLRDRRRGDGVARAGVLGLRPGQGARVLSHAARTGRGAARRQRRLLHRPPAAHDEQLAGRDHGGRQHPRAGPHRRAWTRGISRRCGCRSCRAGHFARRTTRGLRGSR